MRKTVSVDVIGTLKVLNAGTRKSYATIDGKTGESVGVQCSSLREDFEDLRGRKVRAVVTIEAL